MNNIHEALKRQTLTAALAKECVKTVEAATAETATYNTKRKAEVAEAYLSNFE